MYNLNKEKKRQNYFGGKDCSQNEWYNYLNDGLRINVMNKGLIEVI